MLSGKILLRASRNASAFLPRCEYHVYNIMNSLLLSSFYQFSQYLSPVDAVKLLYQEHLGVPAATCAARQECEAFKKPTEVGFFVSSNCTCSGMRGHRTSDGRSLCADRGRAENSGSFRPNHILKKLKAHDPHLSQSFRAPRLILRSIKIGDVRHTDE